MAKREEVFYIEERQRTKRSVREVFEFFDRPENVARVTPGSLAVSLQSHPKDLRQGQIFAYRLQRWPVDVEWDVVVSEYDPPDSFANVKARGFFPKWDHRFTIVDAGDGGAEIRTSLTYEVPSGLLNSLSNTYVIREAMSELVREQTRAVAGALNREDN